MIAEPIRYMVVCDHPEINRRYYVADIDDDRPSGGRVHFQLYRGEMATTATALNKRGSRRVIPFACWRMPAQGRNPRDLLNGIALHRVELFPVAVEPIEAVPDPLRDPDAWFDVIRGVDPGPGPVVGSVERHVIAFKTWCHLVTEFGARDRR